MNYVEKTFVFVQPLFLQCPFPVCPQGCIYKAPNKSFELPTQSMIQLDLPQKSLSISPQLLCSRICKCSIWQNSVFFRHPVLFLCALAMSQKTAFSLVKSMRAIGSPGCSIVRHHAENGQIQKMAADCALRIASKGETLFQTRPGIRNNWPRQFFTQLSLHWVIFFIRPLLPCQ